MSTATRNTKETKMEGKVSSPDTGPRKMGWKCGLCSAGGEEENGVQSKFHIPTEKEDIT